MYLIMKKVFLFMCMLFISIMYVSAQVAQHGLILNGGLGRVEAKIDKLGERWDDIEYKVGLSLGYRLRFNLPEPKSFHYDLDVNVGVKGARVANWGRIELPEELIEAGYGLAYPYSGSSGGAAFHYTSIGLTANYSLIKNLSVGLGLEPTYFLNRRIPGTLIISDPDGTLGNLDFDEISNLESNNRKIKSSFDIPFVAKIAYNLKVVEVSISGKYSTVSVFETDYLKSGKIREVQLSVFIPFKTYR
jgi:hypothetical protein